MDTDGSPCWSLRQCLNSVNAYGFGTGALGPGAVVEFFVVFMVEREAPVEPELPGDFAPVSLKRSSGGIPIQ